MPGAWAGALALAVLAVLQGCSTPPTPPSTQASPAPAVAAPSAAVSLARTPRDYRRDAASHLYALQPGKIYKGRLPPLLYAVGVLQLDLDRGGRITRLHWLRAPSHAPEVMAEIERIVRRAAPFPSPGATVTYTDTWLWDKSGRFQLDTLTEGQL